MRTFEELQIIREKGVTIDNGEHEDEIRCIAAPIFNFEKKVIASISISITTSRSSLDELLSHRPLLLETAEMISQELGY